MTATVAKLAAALQALVAARRVAEGDTVRIDGHGSFTIGELLDEADRVLPKRCPCGSGELRRDLIDARGIFCAFVCDKCEAQKRQFYRADIFTDPNYHVSEPIEPDDAPGSDPLFGPQEDSR